LAWRAENNAAIERDQRAADVAAANLSELLMQTISSLRNTDGLAVDGSVSADEFAAAAANVLPGSLFQAIAYSEVVTEGDRAAFEARSGLTIRDTNGEGDFVDAAARDPHLVVVAVAPTDGAATALLGFDIASDETRRLAAVASAATNEPQLSEPISLAQSAAAGIFVAQRVQRPDGQVIGYLSSGIPVDALMASTGNDGDNKVLTLSLGATIIAGKDSSNGRTASFDAGGKSFTVRADDPHNVNAGLAWLAGIGTLLLGGVVVGTYRRDRRMTARLARSARRDRAMVGLSGRLAGVAASTEVISLVASEAAELLGATSTRVAVYSPTDRSLLLVRRGTRRGVGTVDDLLEVAAPTPLSDCVRTHEPVVSAGVSDGQAGYTWVTGPAVGGDVVSRIAVPLLFHSGECAGAIEFGWSDRHGGSDDDQAAAVLISELTARSYERAVIAELVQGGAARLSDLTQALASASSAVEVIDVVRQMVPQVVGARHALVIMATEGRPGSPLRLDHGLEEFSLDVVGQFRSIDPNDDLPSAQAFATDRMILMEDRAAYLEHYPHLLPVLSHMGIISGAHVPVHDPSGLPIAVLSIAWSHPMSLRGTVRAVLTTIADAVGQTLTRAALYDQEHELIVELQAALLAPVPVVDGLDIAVRYEPAISVVGIGGDWYDAVRTASGRFVAVIGDVTGHGAEAVAMMAQLQAVIVHLTRIDTPAIEVLEHASMVLATAGSYATAQIVEIDVERHTLRYVNAGHPYPLVRRRNGEVEMLTGGHRPLLGINGPPRTAGETHFEPGDQLLLYTDGLIERRDQSIDQHIARLAEVFAADTTMLTVDDALTEVVVAARSSAPAAGMAIDDDMAAVLIRHTGATQAR
jgi:GAF domain-containing protein